MMTDPIADMLTRIRNALVAKHKVTLVPASRIKADIAEILKSEGYINNVKKVGEGFKSVLRLTLRYGPEGEQVITGIERVSRSGLRVYVKKDEVPKVLGGLGVSIISTSQGIMTGAESKKRGLGGEVVCRVW